MALLQCEMCCGELEISTDRSIGVCKYCGSTFTIPREIEKKGRLFNWANYLRQNCNFDKAISVYESILAENCEDEDALWGLVLCRYGIEFVEDPKTGMRIPTCHRASRTSILLDPDYKAAIKYADDEKRAVYVENATKIDSLQKAIISMSDSQEKYEVFICYKESDDSGERTVDSVLAQEIYNELTKMKIKTFFARKTLEGKAGSNYEPIIYSALNSAKVMIVLGTKPEYFEATWVKNEWSRYLSFMKDNDDKHLIPVYRDMSAYKLPEEFMAIQAIDMSRIGFMLDLCDGVKKLLRKNEQIEENTNSPISKDSLYSRAMVFLGNREFYKAVDYFDKVLDIDPKYSKAYWGSLLASYQCVTNNELINHTGDDWTEDAKMKNAMQFAGEEERKIYEDTLAKRVESFKRLANSCLEKREFDKCCKWCEKHLQYQPEEGSLWWILLLASNQACNSGELFNNCLEGCVSVLNSEYYYKATEYSIEEESSMYKNTAAKIESAVMQKRRDIAYNECRMHMLSEVDSLNRVGESAISNSWTDHKQEKNAIMSLKISGADLFGNNLFTFLIKAALWFIVVFAGVGLWFLMADGDFNFIKNLGIAYGIIMLIVVLSNLHKFSSNRKRLPYLTNNCSQIAAKVDEEKRNIADAKALKAKAEAMIKAFESHPDMTEDQISQARAEFDRNILNNN